MNPRLRALQPYPMAELTRRKQELISRGRPLYDFGTGDPQEPTPPFIAEALRQAVPAISQYPTVTGTPALRQAAAGYLGRRFGLRIDPETQVLPAAGSKEAIFHLPLALIDPSTSKDTVIHGTPGYPVYQAGALFAGARELPIVLERSAGYRLDLSRIPREDLERAAIVWLNYPHNPTGACVDRSYYDQQVAIAREHGIVVASDECYQDLWFTGADPPPSCLQSSIPGVLAFHSCSKRSGMTGYRSGFIAGDAVLIAEYRRWRSAMGVGSPAFVEAAAAAAWNDDDHAACRRGIFTAKYRLLHDALSALGLVILPSQAGLYLWAQAPAGDAEGYAQELLTRGIVVSPGGFFGPGGEGWIRLALVPTLEDCSRAIGLWPRAD